MAWLPYLTPEAYVTLLAAGDVMVDPFPFGGGVTTLEALAVCTPVVTAPTLQSVPALAAGMLRAALARVGPAHHRPALQGVLVAGDEAALVANTVALLTAPGHGPAPAGNANTTLLGDTRHALCHVGDDGDGDGDGDGAPVDVLYHAAASVREWEALLYRVAVVA